MLNQTLYYVFCIFNMYIVYNVIFWIHIVKTFQRGINRLRVSLWLWYCQVDTKTWHNIILISNFEGWNLHHQKHISNLEWKQLQFYQSIFNNDIAPQRQRALTMLALWWGWRLHGWTDCNDSLTLCRLWFWLCTVQPPTYPIWIIIRQVWMLDNAVYAAKY